MENSKKRFLITIELLFLIFKGTLELTLGIGLGIKF